MNWNTVILYENVTHQQKAPLFWLHYTAKKYTKNISEKKIKYQETQAKGVTDKSGHSTESYQQLSELPTAGWWLELISCHKKNLSPKGAFSYPFKDLKGACRKRECLACRGGKLAESRWQFRDTKKEGKKKTSWGAITYIPLHIMAEDFILEEKYINTKQRQCEGLLF